MKLPNENSHQEVFKTRRVRYARADELELYSKQPIMRNEDRLFDRGWLRSAMATRKCGISFFPKYFMVVRPFFTRIFFQELFGLEGSKHFLENFVRCTIRKSRTVSYDPRV